MICYRFDCAHGVLLLDSSARLVCLTCRFKRSTRLLDVQIQPDTRFAGLSLAAEGAPLKVKIPARALDGAANAALVAVLAERLGVAESAVKIVRGANSRRKTVEVRHSKSGWPRSIQRNYYRPGALRPSGACPGATTPVRIQVRFQRVTRVTPPPDTRRTRSPGRKVSSASCVIARSSPLSSLTVTSRPGLRMMAPSAA